MPHTLVRAQTVAELHERGFNYAQIGEKLGASRERIRQLHSIHIQLVALEATPLPFHQLSIRLHNALLNDALPELTPEAVRTRYASVEELRRVPGMGEKCVKELQEWLTKDGGEAIP